MTLGGRSGRRLHCERPTSFLRGRIRQAEHMAVVLLAQSHGRGRTARPRHIVEAIHRLGSQAVAIDRLDECDVEGVAQARPTSTKSPLIAHRPLSPGGGGSGASNSPATQR